MTKPKKPDDPDQSERFKQLAHELEADGDLSITEAEVAFERAMGKVAPSRRKAPNEPTK